MLVTQTPNPGYQAPLRANQATPPEPTPAPAPGYDVAGAATAALFKMDRGNARQVAHDALKEISEKASSPVDRKVAEVMRKAAAVQCFPESGVNAQTKTLQALVSGIKQPVGQALSQLGQEAFAGCKQPDEQRRMGREILNGISEASSNPAEVIVARAASEASSLRLFEQSGANLQGNAFGIIKNGVTSAEVGIGQLGLSLPKAHEGAGELVLGEVCSTGGALFHALANATQNPTAKALSEMSGAHNVATEGLRDAQQEAFGDLVAGKASRFIKTQETQYLTPTKNGIASALGGVGTQVGLMLLGNTMPGVGGMLAGMVVGVLAFAAVKGVYHGYMEVQARKTGPMRYDQEAQKGAFGDGFKMGLKSNILPGLLHSSINSMAYSFVGAPVSLAVGPGLSYALTRYIGY